MKKCPICDRTFADGLNFCQTDGTPLIEVSDAVKADSFKPTSAFSSQDDETDFLELSEEADFSPAPASALSADKMNESADDWREKEINSPPPPAAFDESKPVGDQNQFDQSYQTPSPLRMAEIKGEALNTPYAEQVEQQPPPFEQTNWTPPPVPEANWQNQQINQNAPFQPMPAGQAQSQTLAVISLVLGILSIPCCSFIVFGIGAVVTGFIAKGKAEQNPNEYGGRGLALGGMIIGGITILLGIITIIFRLFLFGMFGGNL